jgi:hypothetical protein
MYHDFQALSHNHQRSDISKITLLDCWNQLVSPLLSSKQYEIYNANCENMHKIKIKEELQNYIKTYQNPTH